MRRVTGKDSVNASVSAISVISRRPLYARAELR
jgi:hypothetical protein